MAKSSLQFADFEILHRLGAGGMAEVFLAKKRGAEGTYKLLVVKRILPAHVSSRRFRTMFVEEAQLATRLNHPNIVQVYEFSDHGDEGLVLSMEYVEGFDLGKLVNAARKKGARIPSLVSAFIVAEAAKGLHYAHERKDESGMPLAIVHRDVSPQNILLSHEGSVKIADFGIASANLFREEAGVIKGKFGYMSPEQARGERVDRRSDIYSLGVVLYELLTLRSPYGKLDDDALLAAVQTGTYTPPCEHTPDILPELEGIVLRAMAKSPAERFQTARDMAGAIARVLLAKQELIDNASVEATLAHLLGRDLHGTILPQATAEPQTLAAVPLARSLSDSGESGSKERRSMRVIREVRHVTVVTLRLSGIDALVAAQGPAAGKRSISFLREILENIAYKHGAVWSWSWPEEHADAGPPTRREQATANPTTRGTSTPPRGVPSVESYALTTSPWSEAHERHEETTSGGGKGESHAAAPVPVARSVVGLLANPSRAAADATALAGDVHEALAGASADLPVAICAAVAIVRGIASGERDAQGHLVHHTLQEPANFLADRLGATTPFGATWVAGGVYRLVRRDFLWSEVPPLLIEAPEGRGIPPLIRIYALERRLTREERLDEASLSPHDLVGRDAERADLGAAFHRAITAGYEEQSTPKPPLVAPASFPTSAAFPASSPTSSPVSSAALSPVSSADLPLSSHTGYSLPSLEPRPTPPRKLSGTLVARAIVGEMGIGKTALVNAFVTDLPSEAQVVHVECSPVHIELPFATVADLLRAITGKGIEDNFDDTSAALRELFGAAMQLREASAILDRLAELITGKQRVRVDEDAALYRRDLVVTGVRRLLGMLARNRPLVIIIDGLQWADPPSLELLHELLRRRETVPILVLLLTRPEERVTPFIEGLVRVELRGLSAEEQIRLVETRLGVREGVAAVCSDLLPRVAGNPFFLLEMIDALLERGTLEIVERSVSLEQPSAQQSLAPHVLSTPSGRPAPRSTRLELIRHERPGESRESLPSTLEQLIGDRLRELPPAEHDVVDWLAVAGGPLLEPDLLALARLADDEAISRLCARGVCDRRGGAVDFRHPLVRDVAYLALDAGSQARMHRRLGEHLATTPIAHGLSAAIVARHLARGEAPSAAADLYLEAANAARNAHQAQLAQRYYQRALALLPTGDVRRMVAHEALEAIFRHLGKRRERRTHLTALRKLARENGQARWAALALVRTARLDLDEGYLARGLPVAQRATELTRIARQPTLEVESLTILSEILRDLGDIRGAIEACERALAVVQRGGLHARARAEVLRAKGVLLRYGGRVHEAVEAYAEAIAIFKAVGARRAEARAKNALAFAMFVLERFEDVIALGLSSVAIDLAIGGRFQIAKTLSNVGQAYAKLGDTERGLLYLKRARDAHERYGDQDSRADTLLSTAGILIETSDIDAAHTLAGDASALVAVTGSVYDLAHERIIRAQLTQLAGDPRGAATFAAEARHVSEAQGLVSYHAYATAIEASARIDAGEIHSGILLARTALGAIEAIPSEYGLEIRALACEALRKGAPRSACEACTRAAAHLRKLTGYIRDARLRAMFLRRPVVERILAEARASGVDIDIDPNEEAVLPRERPSRLHHQEESA